MQVKTNSGSDGGSIAREPLAASEAVVRAVAEAEGVSPPDLSVPLYDAIDPDALDQIFSDPVRGSERGVRQLSFPYAGYRVTVCGGDVVSVDVVELGDVSMDA